jgi:hypothetical protein
MLNNVDQYEGLMPGKKIPAFIVLNDDDDEIYLEYYSGKVFHINYSVYMSYVKHMISSNKAQ